MGGLIKVWTGVPEGDFNQLKKEFSTFFQRDWSEVMAGAGQAYSFHRDWQTYLAIADLQEYRVVLAGLTRRLREEGYRIYNTILG